MRVFLIALMIVLLPVRGWMGDAMAIGMAGMLHKSAAAQADAVDLAGATQAAVGASGAGQAGQASHAASMHEDCAGMSMPAPNPSDDGAQAMPGCESCSVCQACNTLAFAPVSLTLALASMAHASPTGALPRFASADPQRGQKPPIS